MLEHVNGMVPYQVIFGVEECDHCDSNNVFMDFEFLVYSEPTEDLPYDGMVEEASMSVEEKTTFDHYGSVEQNGVSHLDQNLKVGESPSSEDEPVLKTLGKTKTASKVLLQPQNYTQKLKRRKLDYSRNQGHFGRIVELLKSHSLLAPKGRVKMNYIVSMVIRIVELSASNGWMWMEVSKKNRNQNMNKSHWEDRFRGLVQWFQHVYSDITYESFGDFFFEDFEIVLSQHKDQIVKHLHKKY